jgi:hypothetical protein
MLTTCFASTNQRYVDTYAERDGVNTPSGYILKQKRLNDKKIRIG